MRYGKILICLLSAMLMAVAVLIWRQEPAPEVCSQPVADIPLSVLVTAGKKTEEIDCWQDEAGNCFVFLPAYAELAETKLSLKPGTDASIAGQPLKNGQTCGGFQWNTPYALEYTARSGSGQSEITFLCSENVPAIYIEVQSGNMDYIHEVKGNEESGRIRLYREDGQQAFSGNLKSISGRGNYTWLQDKKPYSLELTAEADLLGMGQAKEWILLSNPGDPSHLRNKFVYDYAQEAGLAYSPQSRWVDVYLNGTYAGLYLLSERNEIHPQRIDLTADSSFLVSMELGWRMEEQGNPFITTGNGTDLRIHHSSITNAQLRTLWQSAENAILAEDGTDPVTGKSWTELIDLDSWAEKYLIEEIFGSVDACAVSQYFYGSTQDGKIYAGPVWDYDMSMGNGEAWQLSQPEAFFGNRAVLRAWATEPWFHALYQKEEFHDRVVELYREVFQPLLETYLTEKLDSYAGEIRQAAALDRSRWAGKSAAEETEAIRSYMTRRMEFLNSVWLEQETYHTVLVDLNDGTNTVCYAVRPGEYLPELLSIEYIPDAVGWVHRDSGEPFDITQPIREDMDICLKYAEETVEKQEQTSNLRSMLSVVPLAVLVLILLAVLLLDRRRSRKTAGNEAKPRVPHN